MTDATVQSLRDALDRLTAENARLREQLDGLLNVRFYLPDAHLTPHEETLLAALYSSARPTKDTLHNCLYADSIDGGAEPKILDVFVCKLRKKLRYMGIHIKTDWGKGYYLTKESKEKLADLLRERAA